MGLPYMPTPAPQTTQTTVLKAVRTGSPRLVAFGVELQHLAALSISNSSVMFFVDPDGPGTVDPIE